MSEEYNIDRTLKWLKETHPWYFSNEEPKGRGCPPDCNPGFCEDDVSEEECDLCWTSWEKRKPKYTHRDMLKEMDNKKLAEWLATAIARHYDQSASVTAVEKQLWFDWLEREIEDEEEMFW